MSYIIHKKTPNVCEVKTLKVAPRRAKRRRKHKLQSVDFAYVLSRIKLILNYIYSL